MPEVRLAPRTPDPLVVLVVGLAVYDVLRSLVLPKGWHSPANAALGIVVLLYGRSAGLTWAELGLARARLRSGLVYGLAVLGVIVVVLGVLVALPSTRELFPDDTERVSGLRVLLDAAVRIPAATVFPEEVAFRGVLLALLLRRSPLRRALLVHSILFGLWHVPPLLIGAEDGLIRALPLAAGTLAATAVAGLGFAWLRLRSGSLLAPVLAHIGTNSTATVATWVATR
ncbi:MAG: CPBP family intramembrane metalloprotease [Acidimicrobiales bacterium]|nr:CPBP family intramembrane metalloprotease [Acidimicrobiales bacterium]